MNSDDYIDYIDGFPVKYSDFMPKGAIQSDKPILLGKWLGVFRLKVAMCDDGVVRPTEGPENAKVVKELSDWLKQWSGVVDLDGGNEDD